MADNQKDKSDGRKIILKSYFKSENEEQTKSKVNNILLNLILNESNSTKY